MSGQEVTTTSSTEEQFRAFFIENFGFRPMAEEIAAKLLSWAEEVREDDGNFILLIPNQVEPSLVTILNFQQKENRLMAAVARQTEEPEWEGVSGYFLKLDRLTRARVSDEGDTVYFYLRDTAALRIKKSGSLTYFGQLKRKGRGRKK